MTNSDILKLFATVNKNCGYDDYAKILDSAAAVEEAKEIVDGTR